MRVEQMDFVSKDPRSVKAALVGKGDSRTWLWNGFRRYALKRNPKLDEEQLAQLYPAAIEAGWEWRYPMRIINRIAIGVALYALGVLIFSTNTI